MHTLNLIEKNLFTSLFCRDFFDCSIAYKDRIWLTYSNFQGNV